MAKLEEEEGRKCIDSIGALESHKITWCVLARWRWLTRVHVFWFPPAPVYVWHSFSAVMMILGEENASSGIVWNIIETNQEKETQTCREKLLVDGAAPAFGLDLSYRGQRSPGVTRYGFTEFVEALYCVKSKLWICACQHKWVSSCAARSIQNNAVADLR